jgi:low affinity Fe/Cu permease
MTVTKKHGFASMAQNTAKLAGSSSAFVAICLITFVWLVTGPIFHWSDTWQLVINTVTNIVSMLMVFVIQNTQNRESSALQLKIDELLRAVRGAQNTFINLEELSEEDLNELKDKSAALAESARQKAGQARTPARATSRTKKLVAGSHPDAGEARRLVTQVKSG